MNRFLRLFHSTVGQKILMAVTGIILVLWVFAHMLGNLQIFAGSNAINGYASLLKSSGELLWGVRLFLLACIGLHIYSAVMLTVRNEEARPQPYQQIKLVKASGASRTMIYSGTLVLAFVIFHLLHFTAGVLYSQFFNLPDVQGRHDVYRMMVLSFQVPVISLIYLIGVALICAHMSHGINSMFRSVGFTNEAYAPLQEKLAVGLSTVIFLGFASIPVAVLTGVVRL